MWRILPRDNDRRLAHGDYRYGGYDGYGSYGSYGNGYIIPFNGGDGYCQCYDKSDGASCHCYGNGGYYGPGYGYGGYGYYGSGYGYGGHGYYGHGYGGHHGHIWG